jgi:hypothetical protein
MVGARHWTGDALNVAVDHLNHKLFHGSFFAFSRGRGAVGEDDRECYEALVGKDSLRFVPPPLSGSMGGAEALAWLERFGTHNILVATRLHAVILGVRLGVPTVALGYERKVSAFMERVGLEEFLVVSPEPKVIVGAIDLAIDSGPKFQEVRRRLIGEVKRDRAWRSAKLGAIANGRWADG